MLNTKIMRKKIKKTIMIYADFESIYSHKRMESKIQESYTNIYQNHVFCSYGYTLVCVDDKFGKLFKTYLGKE